MAAKAALEAAGLAKAFSSWTAKMAAAYKIQVLYPDYSFQNVMISALFVASNLP